MSNFQARAIHVRRWWGLSVYTPSSCCVSTIFTFWDLSCMKSCPVASLIPATGNMRQQFPLLSKVP